MDYNKVGLVRLGAIHHPEVNVGVIIDVDGAGRKAAVAEIKGKRSIKERKKGTKVWEVEFGLGERVAYCHGDVRGEEILQR